MICNGLGFNTYDCLYAVQAAQSAPSPGSLSPSTNGKSTVGVPPKDWTVAVQQINALRAKHGAGPLVWDTALATAAAETSRSNAAVKSFQHGNLEVNVDGKGPVRVGQNLFAETSSGKLPAPESVNQNAVDAWAAEAAKYNYNTPGFSNDTGHFTQLVWKNTSRIGCGGSYSQGSSFVTCDFYPAGNVQGQFPTNVLRA